MNSDAGEASGQPALCSEGQANCRTVCSSSCGTGVTRWARSTRTAARPLHRHDETPRSRRVDDLIDASDWRERHLAWVRGCSTQCRNGWREDDASSSTPSAVQCSMRPCRVRNGRRCQPLAI